MSPVRFDRIMAHVFFTILNQGSIFEIAHLLNEFAAEVYQVLCVTLNVARGRAE